DGDADAVELGRATGGQPAKVGAFEPDPPRVRGQPDRPLAAGGSNGRAVAIVVRVGGRLWLDGVDSGPAGLQGRTQAVDGEIREPCDGALPRGRVEPAELSGIAHADFFEGPLLGRVETQVAEGRPLHLFDLDGVLKDVRPGDRGEADRHRTGPAVIRSGA